MCLCLDNDLYSEVYNEKNERSHKQMERQTMFSDGKNQYCENYYTTQSNPQIQYNSYGNTIPFFTELELFFFFFYNLYRNTKDPN